MGLSDSIAIKLRKRAQVVTLRLLPDERIVHRSVASIRPGTMTAVAGELLLTTHRLAFNPIGTKENASAVRWTIDPPGAPNAVVGVRAGGERSMLKPPTLVVVGVDGTEVEFGVLHGRTSPNASRKNEIARDTFITELQRRVGGAPAEDG